VTRQRAGRQRVAWRGLTAAAALGALTLVGAADALGQGAGEVTGTVVNGTTGEPVVGLTVAVEPAEPTASTPAERTAESGDDGTFTVEDVADAEGSYVVATAFEGVDYRSEPFELPAAEPVTLEVFDTTTAADGVVVRSWVVWVDRERGVAVQHDLQVENTGKLTYLGTEDPAGGSSRVLRLPLAAGAEDLQFLGRFTECCAELRGETSLVHTTPLAPGTVTGTLRYTVPTLDGLVLPVDLPTDTFSLLVPVGTRVESDLEPVGETESRGTTYQILRATDLAAGDRIVLGLPEMGPPSWSPVLLPVGVALGVLAIGLAVFAWRLRRNARLATDATPASVTARTGKTRAGKTGAGKTGGGKAGGGKAGAGKAGVGKAGAGGAGGPATNGHQGPDPAELLVEEIALLDLAFDRGLVSRDLYEPLRAERKADLLLLRRPTDQRPRKGAR
jgi:hypothetical protein